jgi:ABC-type lipoprotein release transport system permease subunit
MFLLGFLDRRREIAVLKAVGFSGVDIAAVFGLEVTYTGLAGLAVGLAASFVLLTVWLGRRLPLLLVLRATAVTAAVLGLSSLLPIAMASVATVTELLLGRKVIAVFRQRVGGGGGSAAGPGRRIAAHR